MDFMVPTMFFMAGIVMVLFIAVLYLLFLIRKLLLRIACTLDSIDCNSQSNYLYISQHPKLRQLTVALSAISRELKKYIQKSLT